MQRRRHEVPCRKRRQNGIVAGFEMEFVSVARTEVLFGSLHPERLRCEEAQFYYLSEKKSTFFVEDTQHSENCRYKRLQQSVTVSLQARNWG